MRVLMLTKWFSLLLFIVSTFFACGIFDDKESGEAAPFSMEVIPIQIEYAIPGERCVFLDSATDEGQGSGKGKTVAISATIPGSSVT